ncbi:MULTISPECIES: PE-PPE domain-containing protein [Mycolicibacterium]|jgi:hypothetical protein|uniref:PE-PPE domain-containing protein n=2 Tax=Mycolicibacterium TaxID=1866885 RepID=A0ABT8HNK7_MYCAO|nr:MULTISPECIES: PE-PPE domain-containing protein [Mycolicibacterium]MDN4522345.1 PE-PPE domain-containing protein [Mycolicibacterium austroafricanum]MDW5613932.1 PE-PPE domain-containing protein [Mycolicibacterium sp. D5.8-2]QRZ08469.1 PE-PPE domain-containing protein [Mycolicibacterium austroafricanum]QZT58640.1 PE-PPE domain-containing protein [Mycolicibacterium austroafricanum]QZT70120.1 PE-PPE domain-containing protein [Mycolicibacterium austroafricanum]
MKIGVRKAGLACGAAFASAVLAASTATSAWGSSSALVIGGIATSSMHDVVMGQVLGGALKNQQRVSVNWPAEAAPWTGKDDLTLGASIDIGITNLNAQIDAALGRLGKDANGNYVDGEKVTVVGLSAGSLVVNEVLRQLAADADAPDKDQITFIVVADSSRQKLINRTRYNSKFDYTYQPAPETEYDIVVVTGEYDGLADFPDRWWNALAVANAIAGSIYVHVPVMFADLSKVPAENITVDVNSKGGTTTSYLVPTAKLPLVQLFPSLAAKEAELKAKIDKAYSRNDAPPAGALSTLVAAAPAVVADQAAVVEESPAEAVAEPVEQAVTQPVEQAVTEPVEQAVTEPVEQADTDGATPVLEEVVEEVVEEAPDDDTDVTDADGEQTPAPEGADVPVVADDAVESAGADLTESTETESPSDYLSIDAESAGTPESE